jgi:hypothetical protein
MVVTLGILRFAQNDGKDLQQQNKSNDVAVGVTVVIPTHRKMRDGWGTRLTADSLRHWRAGNSRLRWRSRFLHCGGKCAASGRNDIALWRASWMDAVRAPW